MLRWSISLTMPLGQASTRKISGTNTTHFFHQSINDFLLNLKSVEKEIMAVETASWKCVKYHMGLNLLLQI